MNVSLRKLAFELGIEKDALRQAATHAGGSYRSFDLRGLGSSKWRHIDHPQEPLGTIQRKILRRVLEHAEMPITMTGGLPGRSLLDHVAPHAGKAVVITLDLAHCFPSINNQRVFAVFKNRLNYSSDLANLLTKLTTLRRRLPQGAATSPYLAALATEAMHRSIAELCARHDVPFTQFVDDLALSGPAGCQRLVPEVVRIVQAHGFSLARPKVQIMHSRDRQTVTGVVVNKGVSAGAPRIEKIKEQLTSYRDALFILAGELHSLEGKFAFVETLRPEQAERLRRFAFQCLPATSHFPQVLKTGSVERRECTDTHHHEVRRSVGEPEAPRQPSLRGLGRRSSQVADPPRLPRRVRRTKRRGASAMAQQDLALSAVESTDPLSPS